MKNLINIFAIFLFRGWLLSALIAIFVISLFYGGLNILWLGKAEVLPAFAWIPISAVLAVGFLAIICKQLSLMPLRSEVFVSALFGLMLCDAGWRFVKHEAVVYVVGSMLLAAFSFLVTLLLMRRRDLFQLIFSWPALILVQLFLLAVFAKHIGDGLLFNDDHPVFLYRLQQLYRNFPDIPFYSTDWNAGHFAREYFATGSLSVFFLVYPLVGLIGDTLTAENSYLYSWIFAYLFIIIVPWSVYFASRLLGFSSCSAVVAGILICGPSLTYFEWMLKYGTVGFVLSCGLFPLAFALLFRVFLSEQTPCWWHVIVLVLVLSLCALWPLAIVMYVPIGLLMILNVLSLLKKQRLIKAVVAVALFLLLNFAWVVAFVKAVNVPAFLGHSALPGSNTSSIHQVHQKGSKGTDAGALAKKKVHSVSLFKKAYQHIKQPGEKTNPLIWLLAIPGLLMIKNRRLRFVFIFSLLWLLFVDALGDPYFPQLELRRMILVAAILLCPVSGAAAAQLGDSFVKLWLLPQVRGRQFYLAACGVVVAAVVYSPAIAASAYGNKTMESFILAPPLVWNLSAAIKEHGGEGRTFFSSFILHELGARAYNTHDGGHVAPLPSFTGKELYASHFHHTYWSYVDPIPHSYRKRKGEGIEEFLDLINATAVISFRKEWRKYFEGNPRYQQVFAEDRFRLFIRRVESPTFFLRGSGRVERATEGLIVTPESSEVVIKYRYFPGLKTSSPKYVEIFPVPVFEEDIGGKKTREVSFIGLRFHRTIVESKIPIKVGFYLN